MIRLSFHTPPAITVGMSAAALPWSPKIRRAELALRTGNIENAERCAGTAISADDRLLRPLAVKAAISRYQGNETGEQLMTELAKGRKSFGRLVEKYYSILSHARQ